LERKKIYFFLSRLVLRCRQLARERFAQMRSDVLVKLELLDQKHGLFVCFFDFIFISLFFYPLVQDMVFQLHRFISALDKYHKDCYEIMKEADIFPIEVDLNLAIFQQKESNDRDELDDENDQISNNIKQHQDTDDIDIFNDED